MEAQEVAAPESADSLATKTQLGRLLLERGRNEEAKEQLARAVHVYKETLGEKRTKTLAASVQLARALEALGDFDEAAAVLQRVLKHQLNAGNPSEEAIAYTREILDRVNAQSGGSVPVEASHPDGAARR